jgi:hypothetical protein
VKRVLRELAFAVRESQQIPIQIIGTALALQKGIGPRLNLVHVRTCLEVTFTP